MSTVFSKNTETKEIMKEKENHRNYTIVRILSILVVVVLLISTLQILFDVPILYIFFPGLRPQVAVTAVIENSVQKISAAVDTDSYPDIIVQRGLPVEFTLTVKDGILNECNQSVIIPEYDIEKKLVIGNNTLEFTPEEAGVFTYSCWMKMINATITVVDNLPGKSFRITEADDKKTDVLPTATIEEVESTISDLEPGDTVSTVTARLTDIAPGSTSNEVQPTSNENEPDNNKEGSKQASRNSAATKHIKKEEIISNETIKNDRTSTNKENADTSNENADTSNANADTGNENADTGTENADTGAENADTGTANANTGTEDADTNTEDTSIADWIEDKLIPNEDASNGKKEIQTWKGWIFDRDCVGINPVKHTKACCMMKTCIASGLGIIQYVPDKAFDSYTAIEGHLNLDGASKELAVQFLYALPEDLKNNVTVKISGYAVDNIPVDKDEAEVPETDTTKLDHYLKGIHITSIELTYIEGLSTYSLPDPNVSLTQQ